VGGSVIDSLAGLPSTWFTTESLAAGFNRPTKPRDLSQLLPVLGAPASAIRSTSSLKVNRAGNEHLRAKVDKRTRSKWSRVLRYALEYKCHSEPLDQFIKRKGGINKCAGPVCQAPWPVSRKTLPADDLKEKVKPCKVYDGRVA
jgi:hypothetical protein